MGSVYLEDLLGNNYYEVSNLLFSFLFICVFYCRTRCILKGGEKIIDTTIVKITLKDTSIPRKGKGTIT